MDVCVQLSLYDVSSSVRQLMREGAILQPARQDCQYLSSPMPYVVTGKCNTPGEGRG